MKKLTLLTILSLMLCVGVMAQSAPIDMKQQRFVINSFDTNKSDTTECWFKGAFIISDTEVVEKWIKGYKVVFPYKPIPISSLASYRHPENEYFLWADKRRFQQTVIAVIETH